jgi:hypothetical protein
MIGLDMKAGPREPVRLEFPAFATGKGKDRVVPAMLLDCPTTATERAAWVVARQQVPGRDEGESEEAYRERLQAALKAWGADALVGRLDIQSSVSGVIQALAITAHVKALIVGWEHFGDAETGEAVEPTETAVEAALREPRIAAVVERWMDAQTAALRHEGNG